MVNAILGVCLMASVLASGGRAEGRLVQAAHAEIELAPIETRQDGSSVLRVTIRPRPGVHIYAPGQAGYYPLSITFPPDAGIKSGRLDLPPAVAYVFQPTAERFLVYREPFVMTQHVVARRTAKRIAGTLHFQACDENVCFRPETVALVWTSAAAHASAPAAPPVPRR
jgi:DsbC/DsbD-like thiol-disulfide interchange protein